MNATLNGTFVEGAEFKKHIKLHSAAKASVKNKIN